LKPIDVGTVEGVKKGDIATNKDYTFW